MFAETAVIKIYDQKGGVLMKLLMIFSSLLIASGLYAAGEPDWCEFEQNYPMERRGIGCIESCGRWRESAGIEISELYCFANNHAYYTFEDVDHQGEKLVCIIGVKCVSSGGR